MTEIEYPLAVIDGSKPWWDTYDVGRALDSAFPGQDGIDLAYAAAYNEKGPLDGTRAVTGLLMVQQGFNDGDSWIWIISFGDGSTYFAEGWCDYTGWDCQSDITWEKYES